MSGQEPSRKRSRYQKFGSCSKDVDDGQDDPETRDALEEISSCQNEITALTQKAKEEVQLVNQKYNALKQPFFDKRTDVINKVPNFWRVVLENNWHTSGITEGEDSDILDYLSKLDVVESADSEDFHINFHFQPNPYFNNEVITKSFLSLPCGILYSESSELKWKEGRPAGKRAGWGRKRPLEETTFLSWFAADHQPTRDPVAEAIRTDLWTDPVKYYAGKGDEESGWLADICIDGSETTEKRDSDQDEGRSDKDDHSDNDDRSDKDDRSDNDDRSDKDDGSEKDD